MAWSAEQYLKFRNERTQAALDLIGRLSESYETILDIGSGPGNSTYELKKKFPSSDIKGLECDPDMIRRARESYPELTFVQGAAPKDLSGSYDLVFSNACIHWIPDQMGLCDKVCSILKTNGTYAVQLPLTQESPFYQLLYQLTEKKWHRLGTVRNFYNLSPEGYYDLLSKRFKSVTLWKTDYYHIVDSHEDILEWYRGSGLRPYLERLSEDEQEEFLSDLLNEIRKKYLRQQDGRLFLIMPRLFFICKK